MLKRMRVTNPCLSNLKLTVLSLSFFAILEAKYVIKEIKIYPKRAINITLQLLMKLLDRFIF